MHSMHRAVCAPYVLYAWVASSVCANVKGEIEASKKAR
jgi:hypothetical protein